MGTPQQSRALQHTQYYCDLRNFQIFSSQSSLLSFRLPENQKTKSAMSKIFNWEYFSFVTLDDAVAYKEVLVVPALIFVLSMVWMQLVKGHGEEEVKKDQTERKINFEQAYQDAVMNEVDSGTELESQGEEEEEVAAPENKDDGEKKDD